MYMNSNKSINFMTRICSQSNSSVIFEYGLIVCILCCNEYYIVMLFMMLLSCCCCTNVGVCLTILILLDYVQLCHGNLKMCDSVYAYIVRDLSPINTHNSTAYSLSSMLCIVNNRNQRTCTHTQ